MIINIWFNRNSEGDYMAGEIIDDNFLTINDDFNKYIQYLRLIFADYAEVVESIDKIIDENVFNKQTYVELTGIIKYTSKRVFPSTATEPWLFAICGILVAFL